MFESRLKNSLSRMCDMATHHAMSDDEKREIINEARAAITAENEHEKAEEDRTKRARDQASAQMESISAMVAALECDYSRLEELREELETLQVATQEAAEAVDDIESGEAVQSGEDVDACETLREAEDALYQFGLEYGEELRELMDAAGNCSDEDEARETIQEDALEVSIRTGWYSPGDKPEAEEFKILLCTGGPAVRIVGELDQYNQPSRAWLEYQDWFTPWIEYHGENVDAASLLTYSQQFYFEE